MKIAFIIIFVLSSIALQSQNVQFTATVNKNPITEGENFQLTYTLNSSDGKNFRAPSFTGFNRLQGPRQSSQTRIVNGRFSSSLTFTYILKPKKKGTFTIKPARVRSGGKTISSNAIQIQVLPPSEAEKRRRQQKATEEQTLTQQANKLIRDNLYVKSSISKRSIYLNEQITATYKLYTNPELNIQSLEISNSPSFSGFWSQDFDTKDLKWETEVVNGVKFRVANVKRMLLLPQKTGNVTIEPLEFSSVVRLRTKGQQRRRRSLFDDFFDNGSFKDFPYKIRSKAIKINVKELPPNAPPSFNGAVGRFEMEAWFDNTQTVVNEPVTLKVKISGKGNLKLIEPLEIDFPNDLEAYDPKTADNVTVSLSGASGNKIFEYLLIPRNAGEYKIKPVEFTYFDLGKKEYITLSSDAFIIQVGKGDGEQGSGVIVRGINKEEVQLLGKDIRHISNTTRLLSINNKSFFGNVFFYMFLLIPALLFIIFLLYRKKNEELNKNQSLLKNKRATKVAKKRLQSAKKYLSKSNDNDTHHNGSHEDAHDHGFHDELLKCLWGYLGDKLSIPVAGLTKDSAKDKLSKFNIPESMINDILTLIDECEFAKYSPTKESKDRQTLYGKAEKSISELEGVIK